MYKYSIIISLIISILFLGCKSSSTISTQNNMAKQAVINGDFETAYKYYVEFINEQQAKDKEISGDIYNEAAKAALGLKKYSEAENFFQLAKFKTSADADLYASMSKVYKMIDNLSKELDAVEYFVDHFKLDARHHELKMRLFSIYIESENWEKALNLWPSFDETDQMDEKLLQSYFIVHKSLKNTTETDAIASKLLKLNVTNKLALEWMAEKYFWKAENKYQAEMEAYENNKTNSQYNILLKALNVVTSDFKKSLSYYEKLYKMYPSKEYAKYISNIYVRFQDKKKADYYRKLSL
jgi:tetratricopeptide (TPR) repeat protein